MSGSVPLADDLRAARAALRRAELGTMELAQIEVALASLQRGLPVDPEWADGFAARWPELGSLRPTDRTLLLAVRGALLPVARGLGAAANRLHHLQHEQLAALGAPGLEALRAELEAELAELGALSRRRTVPMQRAAALGPALEGVDRAAAEVELAEPPRARALVDALSESLAPVFAALQLEIELPARGPDPLAEIRALQRALRAVHAEAAALDEETRAAWESLNARLLERMG